MSGKKWPADDPRRAMHRERFREFNKTDAAKRARSVSSAANWNDPELRQQMTLGALRKR